jgi:pimeloyl-ACP methyl ester carboxylesterase
MQLSLDAPERLGHSTLADGRRLAWAEWGSPRGTPLVLCPGAAISRHLGISARAVATLGVRLISVDRPGLGASTPAPGRTLADFAADVGELVELRGLGRPAVIGNSQGLPSPSPAPRRASPGPWLWSLPATRWPPRSSGALCPRTCGISST